MTRIAVATRPRTYPFRRNAFRVRVWKANKPKWDYRDDPGGTGWEIAREAAACPDCASTRAEAGMASIARDPPSVGAA